MKYYSEEIIFCAVSAFIVSRTTLWQTSWINQRQSK